MDEFTKKANSIDETFAEYSTKDGLLRNLLEDMERSFDDEVFLHSIQKLFRPYCEESDHISEKAHSFIDSTGDVAAKLKSESDTLDLISDEIMKINQKNDKQTTLLNENHNRMLEVERLLECAYDILTQSKNTLDESKRELSESQKLFSKKDCELSYVDLYAVRPYDPDSAIGLDSENEYEEIFYS